MFSQGQLVFAALFFIAFVILVGYAYRKDLPLHKIFYKDNYKILIAFIGFIAVLFLIKVFFKR